MTFRDLVARFGGPRLMSAKTNVTLQTVYDWIHRQGVPTAQSARRVQQAAAEHGIAVGFDEILEPLTPPVVLKEQQIGEGDEKTQESDGLPHDTESDGV